MAERNKTVSPPPSRKRKRASQNDDTVSLNLHRGPRLSRPPHHLCIYSWNINGIAPFIQPSIATYFTKIQDPANIGTNTSPKSDDVITTSLRNFLKRHQWPQVLHLQEVKINPNDINSQNAVKRAANVCQSGPDQGPRYVTKFCLPRDRYNALGFGRKIYGVCTIIREDFFNNDVEIVREVDWDKEGRVLVTETKHKLSIWNLYCVNGTTNPYKHTQTGGVIGTRHDRKLAFHRHLLEEAKRLEARGYRLILGGDMNVARAPIDGHPRLRISPEQHVINRKDFNSRFFEAEDGLRGIDAFRHLHPDRKGYTYMPRSREWGSSCDRVDLFILSRSLVQVGVQKSGGAATADVFPEPAAMLNGALVASEILDTEADRGPSDHLPLFVELDLTKIDMESL